MADSRVADPSPARRSDAALEPGPPALQWRWDSELVVLAAESRDDLVRRAQRLAGWCEANVDARLLDVAFSAAAGAADGPPLRLGVVASSLGDLSV